MVSAIASLPPAQERATELTVRLFANAGLSVDEFNSARKISGILNGGAGALQAYQSAVMNIEDFVDRITSLADINSYLAATSQIAKAAGTISKEVDGPVGGITLALDPGSADEGEEDGDGDFISFIKDISIVISVIVPLLN